MKKIRFRTFLPFNLRSASLTMLAIGFLLTEKSGAEDKIDFNRDIRPILSDNCFACHGPDDAHREADLRLDERESAVGTAVDAAATSADAAIVPHESSRSLLMHRIQSTDSEALMPPPTSGKKLSSEQIELLRRWIDEGAEYRGHWAFEPIVRPHLPQLDEHNWSSKPIDQFIYRELERAGLEPNHSADKHTLIRRVTFDLTGLPATPEEIEAYVNDTSADAYERVVDRLLQSPHYGEHQARFWLDAVRYGDTHGLHLDNYREFWLYRDWIIKAFSENKRFDEFVREQLAGDLLPNPTNDQLIATGFNRAHVTTAEGGSIEEEVHIRNVVDRVSTVGTVFLGMTFNCAVCHDHKYDPITQRDFYSLSAYFNSLDQGALDGNIKDPPPVLRVPTAEQQAQMTDVRSQIAEFQQQIKQIVANQNYTEPATPVQETSLEPTDFVWFDDATPDGATLHGEWNWCQQGDAPVLAGERAIKLSASGLQQYVFEKAPPIRIADGDKLFANVWLDPELMPEQIMLQWNDGSWDHRAYWGADKIDWGINATPSRVNKGELPAVAQWVRLEVDAQEVGLKPGSEVNGWAITQFGGTAMWDKCGVLSGEPKRQSYRSLNQWLADIRASMESSAGSSATLPEHIRTIMLLSDADRTEEQRKLLQDYFVEHVYAETRPLIQPLESQIKSAETQLVELEKAFPSTLISKEPTEPREAFILTRGDYDKRGEQVVRAVPAFLPPLAAALPNNRLGLAEWLLGSNHPLLARVTVNRFWQQFFGVGIVRTAEDFGAQGEWPSHPELLDWLAVEFRESEWDVKALVKQIVMSQTYCQSSQVSAKKLQVDPQNRLCSRGPRYRLDAEMLRDQALAVSGLLVEQIGGPSVKPPQPELWSAVGYSGSNTVRFQKDVGHENVHRRSLYTFWKKTSPPPQMVVFDAPSRESCVVRRERTNTPLQALMLMNDPQYIEAARYLAQRTIDQELPNSAARLGAMFIRVVGRPVQANEAELLLRRLDDFHQQFEQDSVAAKGLVKIGEEAATEKYDCAELAAWTMIANTLLNLDEVITKN